jgi:HAE1 family hydrophobic/amphiphilic exporter-1
LFQKLKNHPGLKDPDLNFRPGKPEFQVVLDNRMADRLGVSTSQVGMELRTLVEGSTPAVFRERGREYDIRVRLKEDQRNLKTGFLETYVPNINYTLIRLASVAKGVDTTGPATISRRDRGRYVEIGADIAPNGPGMAGVMDDINRILKDEMPLPPGMSYTFVGQAESFKEMGESMVQALILAVIFIYLVLASLYESFITPFTIMLVLPLAICGAFLALFITRHAHDLNSWIGCILLLGVATKNSILLVDCANQLMAEGMERSKAVIEAGRTRLRPILMTTFALIAGMLPVAIGLNEASKQRTSMGIAVIGGLISSTFLSLIIVPACFSVIDEFRIRSRRFFSRVLSPQEV